jgi:hypothetical protein
MDVPGTAPARCILDKSDSLQNGAPIAPDVGELHGWTSLPSPMVMGREPLYAVGSMGKASAGPEFAGVLLAAQVMPRAIPTLSQTQVTLAWEVFQHDAIVPESWLTCVAGRRNRCHPDLGCAGLIHKRQFQQTARSARRTSNHKVEWPPRIGDFTKKGSVRQQKSLRPLTCQQQRVSR